MHTIQLKINDKVYDRFLWLLSKFSKEEVEIVNEDQDFILTQAYLQKELDEIQNGSVKFISQSEFESRLDQIIH
jgi:hypothetical protein